ncbi:MAG: phosphoadenylyl-sulfate reductase [Pseudomonadota bacterium]
MTQKVKAKAARADRSGKSEAKKATAKAPEKATVKAAEKAVASARPTARAGGEDTSRGAAARKARRPSAQLAARLNSALEFEGDVVARLRMVGKAVGGRITFSTSLGLEDQALLHALAESGVPVDVFTLDTGRHFPETLDVLDRSNLKYGRRVEPIRLVFPDALETEELVTRDGVFGFRASVEQRKACCDVRKVRPLNRSLSGAAVWLTGLRRAQSAGRASVPFAEYDDKLDLLKINPLADWSLEWLDAYVEQHRVPVNELHSKGYPSIGCQPCTRAIEEWEDIRAGRWWWENEDGKECGLHSPNRPKATAIDVSKPNAPILTVNGKPKQIQGQGTQA